MKRILKKTLAVLTASEKRLILPLFLIGDDGVLDKNVLTVYLFQNIKRGAVSQIVCIETDLNILHAHFASAFSRRRYAHDS